MRPLKIISGGQTGVDRAALDVAIELSIPHGGWCPRERLAEDGRIPDRYMLSETAENGYLPRTRRNVEASDLTLVLHAKGPLRGGTERTVRFCRSLNKRCLVEPIVGRWIPGLIRREVGVGVLNIAGPRESSCPGIYETAREFLLEVLR